MYPSVMIACSRIHYNEPGNLGIFHHAHLWYSVMHICIRSGGGVVDNTLDYQSLMPLPIVTGTQKLFEKNLFLLKEVQFIVCHAAQNFQ